MVMNASVPQNVGKLRVTERPVAFQEGLRSMESVHPPKFGKECNVSELTLSSGWN
jgi:hypothetical protein